MPLSTLTRQVGRFQNTVSFGSDSLTSAGGTDMFIMRVDDSGSITWVVRYGGSGADMCDSVTSDGSGGALVSCYFEDSVQFGSTTFTSAGSRYGAVRAVGIIGLRR